MIIYTHIRCELATSTFFRNKENSGRILIVSAGIPLVEREVQWLMSNILFPYIVLAKNYEIGRWLNQQKLAGIISQRDKTYWMHDFTLLLPEQKTETGFRSL